MNNKRKKKYKMHVFQTYGKIDLFKEISKKKKWKNLN